MNRHYRALSFLTFLLVTLLGLRAVAEEEQKPELPPLVAPIAPVGPPAGAPPAGHPSAVESTPSQEAQAVQKAERPPFISVGVRMGLLVPSGEVDSTFNFNFEVRYIPKFLNGDLSFGVETGLYPFWGEGQGIDPQIGVYDFEWTIYSIPARVGAYYQLPLWRLLKVEWPVDLYVTGGYTMLFTTSTGKVIEGDISRRALAFGGHFGAGVELTIWKLGRLQGEARYSTAHTDMDLPFDNPVTGDLGGWEVFAGYRFIF